MTKYDDHANGMPQEKKLVVDIGPLFPTAKIIPPEKDQLPKESRRFWAPVTKAIMNKQYGQATIAKQEIEERQREKAAERQNRNVEWQPRFFAESVTPVGRPVLTREGRDALSRLQKKDYHLEPSIEMGA